jgi:hypothetical protein
MPESKDNMVVRGLSGNFAGMCVFHNRGRKTFMRKIPAKPSVPASEKQKAGRKRFADCQKYANAANKDPLLKAGYAAKAKSGESAYNRALSDALLPPKLGKFNTEKYQGRPNDSFTVEAKDDFMVISITITIHNATGELIEQGNAVMELNEIDWLYVATADNENFRGSIITATAMDLPGNKTIRMLIFV